MKNGRDFTSFRPHARADALEEKSATVR